MKRVVLSIDLADDNMLSAVSIDYNGTDMPNNSDTVLKLTYTVYRAIAGDPEHFAVKDLMNEIDEQKTQEMMEVIIPGTDKKYSISDEGVVYSNYRYDRYRGKVYRKKTLPPFLPRGSHRTACVYIITGKTTAANRGKYVAVTTLMIQCFNLTPPDEYHQYDLVCKNGDPFNISIKNLEYRIRTQTESGFDFYPQPFYNSKREITHKICGRCGEKKDIDCFKIQRHPGTTKRTYINVCVRCTSVGRRNYFNSEKLVRYRKSWRVKQNESIGPYCIAASLKIYKAGLIIKDLTPELIELTTKKILLHRTIKNHTYEKAD